ncbi:MAG: crossover junction endodeoxyribonuclease RuvC [Candidatus Omnitrophota bacterium]
MKILGVDPGLGITGYGLVDDTARGAKLIEAGVIRTSAEKGIMARLLKIYDGLSEIIEEYRPEVIVIEKIYSHYKHPRTAILMSHARGIVCLLAGKYNLELINYASTHVKKTIAGRGHASKNQVAGMVKTLLSLKEVPKPEDVTDALALAMSHLDFIKVKRRYK